MDNTLKVWRAKRALTQQELATEVDVSRQTINVIEEGRYEPSLELAFKLEQSYVTENESEEWFFSAIHRVFDIR
ncbi:helix-turn-helix transcriptional regulator [Haladaptatus salinisoli]|uniref:helix-turn-helix transcriptional regulator n=1 Tax=Haladaptatus salinisoli TaxID=2884876 RepID=UPI001D0AE223|nr:helix-turn-helix transcriptional regulator [Haladaptatus salinisoli]